MAHTPIFTLMKIATLDTCAIIAMFRKHRSGHAEMCLLREAYEDGTIRLVISRRTLSELSERADEAFSFANRLPILPYYPIGSWNDVSDATWEQLAGTWDDGADEIQRALPVRNRVKIKDRGILIDSMRAGIELLVTTDGPLLKRADGVQKSTGVRPVSPGQAKGLLLR